MRSGGVKRGVRQGGQEAKSTPWPRGRGKRGQRWGESRVELPPPNGRGSTPHCRTAEMSQEDRLLVQAVARVSGDELVSGRTGQGSCRDSLGS